MNLEDFPGCCTAKIITGLGGGATVDWRLNNENVSKESLESLIRRSSHYAVITAITAEDQEGNKLLEEFGFKSTGWISKKQHPESRVKLWWYIVGEEEPKTKEQ